MYQDEQRICQVSGQAFTIESEDFGFYEKIGVPPPTFAPDERRRRRMAWRNDTNFFRRTCDLTGKSIISIYRPDSGIEVYAPKAWYSDQWDPFSYGRDYDPSRSFFEQYVDLLRAVPKVATMTDDGITSVGCQYTNDLALGKNCYMVIKAWKLEDVMYSFYVIEANNLVDVHTSFGKDEGNYETVNTQHCYQCRYVYDSRGCSDCAMCYDCRGCDHCFMCTGLRNQSYCFQNQPVGKERYQQIIEEYKLHTYSGTQRALQDFAPLMQKYPRRALRMVQCEDCLGDLVYNSHNCKYCFVTVNSENYKYGDHSDGVRDSLDVDAGGGSELAYESIVTAFCSRAVGCFWTWYSQDVGYCEHCNRVSDCFGCSGIKDAQYCILNKRYSKDEYFALRKQIIQQMIEQPYVDDKGRSHTYGDYLPIELSYFPYDDTPAQPIFPLTQSQANELGYPYAAKDIPSEGQATMQAADLPDSIDDVTDAILQEVIQSQSSDKRYRIVDQELQFYRRYKIPLPRESFFERHARRHKLATTYRLFERTSDKSGLPIISSYPPDAPEIVWSIDEHKAEFE